MGLLTKDQFCKCIKEIQRQVEFDNEVWDLVRKYDQQFFQPDTSSLGYVATVILDVMFDSAADDGYGDVSYFCHELDFGKKWEPGMVADTDKDGNKVDVDFSSAEKLYEYLTKNMEEQNAGISKNNTE